MNLTNLANSKTGVGCEDLHARALLCCGAAKELEESGDYEQAAAVLNDFWPSLGSPPAINGLDDETAATVLLRVGALTGWIGSSRQAAGTQEQAKNLISESARLFQSKGKKERAAEAHVELALCYWREGALDEARVLLREAQAQLSDPELKATALLRSAIVERTANHFQEMLRICTEAAPLFDTITSHSLKGRFHNSLATVLKNLGTSEQRADYMDRAFVEFAAASFHFEQAGHARYQARVENNLGMLFLSSRSFPEAYTHLDRARRLFSSLGDKGSVAQVDESRARALLKEDRFSEAEQVARSSVRALEKGGEQSLLAEALIAHGTAQARLEKVGQSLDSLHRAVATAQDAGDSEVAGIAAVVILEELVGHLTPDELKATFERASDLLVGSQSASTLARLNTCARAVIRVLTTPQPPRTTTVPPSWRGFSLKKAVHAYERRLIERALKETDGVVSRAAQLLGFEHHQNLVHLLNGRHKELLPVRTPVIRRRRSLMSKSDNKEGEARERKRAEAAEHRDN